MFRGLLLLDEKQKVHVEYGEISRTSRVCEPASPSPVFLDTLRLYDFPAKNHHKRAVDCLQIDGAMSVAPDPNQKSFTKMRKTPASNLKNCSKHSPTQQYQRLATHQVPQVCNVNRRCGSSRAMFVHVHSGGTQSGRGRCCPPSPWRRFFRPYRFHRLCQVLAPSLHCQTH